MQLMTSAARGGKLPAAHCGTPSWTSSTTTFPPRWMHRFITAPAKTLVGGERVMVKLLATSHAPTTNETTG